MGYNEKKSLYVGAALIGLAVAFLVFSLLSITSTYGWGTWAMPMGHGSGHGYHGGYGGCPMHSDGHDEGYSMMGDHHGGYYNGEMHEHCMEECSEHMGLGEE